MSKRKIIAPVVGTILLAGIVIGATAAHAENEYQNFVTEISTAETAYQQAASGLERVLAETPEDELLHTELIATAEQALAEEPKEYELDPYVEKLLNAFNYTPEYPLRDDQQQELHAWYDGQIEDLTETASDIQNDHAAWILQKAKDDMNAVIAKAQETLDAVKDELTKPELTDTLKTLIEKAQDDLDVVTDPDTFTAYAKDIQENTDTLQADHDAYVKQKEEEAAKAAQEAARRKAAAAAAAQSSSTGSSGGSWTVNAVPSYGTAAAPADGSVGEWQSGYYIAHDWSSAGQQIASKPAHVTVNGQIYHYVSSIVVPADTTWDSVAGFVYANGGIGFQTCVGDQRLITHYEPGA